jgi:hypothetical protein
MFQIAYHKPVAYPTLITERRLPQKATQGMLEQTVQTRNRTVKAEPSLDTTTCYPLSPVVLQDMSLVPPKARIEMD